MNNVENNIKEKYSQEEKMKAAYALNLCTVSVSQIIDYDDVYILEQEYEMILNNLNLENMPKDEALLNILKQLLDVITFFRIQKSEKKLLEEEYQQKMSNAVWSAVPNLGLIVAGGSPWIMAISLASQIGIGYMNYRRTKAENDLEQKRANWQLQRAAIEQLNGLRRELFDTAWRLADEYDFSDEYRLTEKQIEQYNAVLMDPDPLRKYERMDYIKDKFKAYVPFWYHFGNTANQIAHDKTIQKETRHLYQTYALDHFETFHELNDKKLLREDQIASACALEYVDLLDLKEERDKINSLIDAAVKQSGDCPDILQLCAFAYLKTENMDKAVVLLRQLVNENYNKILNAQFLSNIYVSNFIYKKEPENAQANYEILGRRVPEEYLFPFPIDGVYGIDKLKTQFFENQKQVLRIEWKLLLKEYIKKYTIKYNKVFPVPNPSKEYNDAYFLDSSAERSQRLEDLADVFENKSEKQNYCERLRDDKIIYDLFEVINEMYEAACELNIGNDYDGLQVNLSKGIRKNKDKIVSLLEDLSHSRYDAITINRLSDIAFSDIAYRFLNALYCELKDYIDCCESMEDIIFIYSKLCALCKEQNLIMPDKLFERRNKVQDFFAHKRVFTPKLLGTDYEDIEKANETKEKLLEIVKQYEEKIIINEKTLLLYRNTPHFESFFNNSKGSAKKFKNSTIVILDAKSSFEADLLLTDRGIVVLEQLMPAKLVPYGEVKYENDLLKGLGYDENKVKDFFLNAVFPPAMAIKRIGVPDYFMYRNKNVNKAELYSLLCELAQAIPKDAGHYESEGKDRYAFLEEE